jgi:hypothetical protein
MIGLVLASLPLLLAAEAAAPTDGVEGLCAQVARLAAPLIASKPTALQVEAEGAALDLAEAVRGRCAQQVLGEGHRPVPLAAAERTVRLRLRLAPPSLIALVEVTGPGHSGSPSEVFLAQPVEAPAGASLARWLSATGSGLETWVAGSIDGEVLALCGDDGNGDGTAEVAFVTANAIEVTRWTAAGFEFLTRVELPPSLRPHARAPGASATCRAADGVLLVAFGIHDRGRGGLLRVVGTDTQPIQPLDGVPIGISASGQPIIADGVPGTGLIRWKGEQFAQAVAVPTAKGLRVLGVTQQGAPWLNETFGRPFTAGTGLAAADLDGTGTLEAVLTKPVFAGSASEDRLLLTSLDSAATVRHQSAAIRGALGPVGVVNVNGWQRVLAAEWLAGRSQIYAVGRRLPLAAR